MTTREWPWSPAPSTGRQWAAAGLRRTSRALAQLARHLGRARRGPARAPVLEFYAELTGKTLLKMVYAEAGAPEGALYIDGQLVGHLPGVMRL